MHNPTSDTAIFTEPPILASLPIAIIIVNKHGLIYYRNPAAVVFLSTAAANLNQLSSSFKQQDLLQAIKQVNKKATKTFEGVINFDLCHSPGLYQLKMVPYFANKKLEGRHSQDEHFYLITLNPENQEHSAHIQPSAYKEATQYTLLKKNFKELKQFSRLSAMREISSTMADQLNQPLTAILTYTQAMQRLYHNNASSEEISDAMKRVVINAENAGGIIRNIREQLKANNLNCQDTSINHLIQQSIHLTELDSATSQINLITHFDPLSTKLCVDSIQFKQVILSLLNNAIDALKNNHCKDPTITLSTHVNDSCYEITLEDNGPGIPKEIQGLLFEPFITTKEDGIGIGLSMCHHIIELHKGSISISSGHNLSGKKPGSRQPGTNVTIWLPLHIHSLSLQGDILV